MSAILYRFDGSPFSTKVSHLLLLKNIPHKWVNVSRVMPRPEIGEMLGIGHRRSPILAIGRDVYCDTFLISNVLERRFADTTTYPTIFPPKKNSNGATSISDATIMKLFAKHWAEDMLFFSVIIMGLTQFENLPAPFLRDRETLIGRVDVEKAIAERPAATSNLVAHLASLEDILVDGREWIFDTVGPSYADVSVVMTCRRAHLTLGPDKTVFNAETFPRITEWMARCDAHFEALEKGYTPEVITGDEAAACADAAENAYEDIETLVGFDKADGERLGVSVGDRVSATCPGSNPTEGVLVALSREEVVLETKGTKGTFRCHFPRIDLTIRRVVS
ncbi:Glutathione S-transferase [Mycena chlorophos]|uniref:Glutathione S-transferase n=1 Tax=Mycena chlorophos TaxID=658473 RepID=A0A8H6VVS4_MYCCL|nr:Glutathione S-transferase [Mycena chlorophos]